MNDIAGKTVWLTGALAGIGAALALALSAPAEGGDAQGTGGLRACLAGR